MVLLLRMLNVEGGVGWSWSALIKHFKQLNREGQQISVKSTNQFRQDFLSFLINNLSVVGRILFLCTFSLDFSSSLYKICHGYIFFPRFAYKISPVANHGI